MIIFVKTLSGKTITLDVNDTDTVESVKKQIAIKENVPEHKQRIVYAGKDLDDTKTLGECAIKKESIIHLVLKASEKNLDLYSASQKAELSVAQTQVSQYYNPSAGLQDELRTYKDSESKFDNHANPQGSEYDLGKDDEFRDFVVLLGIFVGASLEKPIAALQRKGFKVVSTSNEKSFVENLHKADIAWILSGARPNIGGGYFKSYETIDRASFVEAVVKFHSNGGGLFIWGDNDPLFEHANDLLPQILNDKQVKLVGDTPADKTLKLGNGNKTGHFSPHIIFTGIISLYEGVTICYPEHLGPLQVLATSTDAHPVVCCADNEALGSNTVGRLMVDCGYTKNYCKWDAAGSARYIINATIWLLGLEHKVLHNIPILGKNKQPEFEIFPSSTIKIHSSSDSNNDLSSRYTSSATSSSTSSSPNSTDFDPYTSTERRTPSPYILPPPA